MHRHGQRFSRYGLFFLAAASFALVLSAAQSQIQIIGKEPSLAEVTSIARLMADPEAFAGKTVRVEGKVLDVCPKKGCWMDLGADGTAVKIKVEDDVLVFPRDSKGGTATAEGVVEVQEMSKEQFTGWMRHLAEEQGKPFDAASVGGGPYRVVQIRGFGARVAMP